MPPVGRPTHQSCRFSRENSMAHCRRGYAAFLPYRPLPFLTGNDAQIRPKQALRPTPKLLITANFAITLEKSGRQKINSPSRHQANCLVFKPLHRRSTVCSGPSLRGAISRVCPILCLPSIAMPKIHGLSRQLADAHILFVKRQSPLYPARISQRIHTNA